LIDNLKQDILNAHSLTHSLTHKPNNLFLFLFFAFRATLHTRLRARYLCTSSTLIGGKGGAGPSLLYTMLGGPTE
jgi:hypothetical protein